MEVVGSVASIAQLIEVTAKICNYCGTVLGASKLIDDLGRTLSMMLQLLYQIKAQADIGASTTNGHSVGPLDLIRELQECMISLGQQFEKLRSKNIMAKIRFAHMEKDIQKTIDKASRMNGLLNSWLTLDIKQTTRSIDDGVKVLNHHAEQEDINGKIDRIVEYYAPESFSEKHRNVLDQRQDGTGQWFVESPEFQDWLKSSGGALWCSGAPGAGKTVMASTTIEYLREKVRADPANGLAFVYCDYRQRQSQKAWVLLGNLWAQLFRQRGPSATEVDQIFGEMFARRDFRPNKTQIISLLRDELASGNLERAYIIVDAIDECSDENERKAFMDSLHSLQPSVNVLVTSRTIHSDDVGLQDVRPFRFVPKDEDMGIYINARIADSKKLSGFVTRKPELREEIRRIVIERANGMFLLCRMHLDSLSKAINLKVLKNELNRIPIGENVVKDTYDQAMERIRDQGDSVESFAMQVIRWVCFAKRPLKLAELLCALAVSPGEEEFDDDAVAEESDIANYCAGLVVVEGESKTVRFVHYTTQEYFNSLRSTPEFIHSHGDVALTCISFLVLNNLQLSKDSYVAQIWPLLDEMPFLAYAALYFGYHYTQELKASDDSEYESVEEITDLLLEFLQSPEHLQRASTMILTHIGGRTSRIVQDPVVGPQIGKNATAIDIAAFFNIVIKDTDKRPLGVSLEWLVENTDYKTDLNGSRFGNPLHWASFNDSLESMNAILSSPEINVDINMVILPHVGWRPSNVSIAYGSLSTLQALLDHGIDIYTPTALEWRTSLLQEAIVWARSVKGPDKTALINVIMERDVTRELLLRSDVYGRTALMEAVRTGDFNVFGCVMEHYERMESRRDRAILNCDREARSALHWAVADPSFAFKPTDRATASGPLRILEALLDSPYSIRLLHTRDRKRDTPLEDAIRRNHMQAVDTILNKYDYKFNEKSDFQLISGLHLAAQVADPPMIDMFIGKIRVDLLGQLEGDSVLHHAAGGNKPENVEYLLQKLSKLHLYDIPGKGGNLPLHYAAASGNIDAVAALLKQYKLGVDSKNNVGYTALHLAVGRNLVDVSSYLLESGADINIEDNTGITPLKLAIKQRSTEMLAIMFQYFPVKDIAFDASDMAWIQQQPWGNALFPEPNGASKATVDLKYWPKQDDDIKVAALCLQRKFREGISTKKSPIIARLIFQILDLAEYWVRTSTVRVSINEIGEVRRWEDPSTPFTMSKTITGQSPKPVRRVLFEITGHDQGYCSDPSRGESWTWFTADIHRRQNSNLVKDLVGLQDQGTTNKEIKIVHNRGANRKWFTHKVTWSLGNMKAADSERRTWMRALMPGDKISVVPHARYPGWENWVRRVKIDVFTTCLKGYGEY